MKITLNCLSCKKYGVYSWGDDSDLWYVVVFKKFILHCFPGRIKFGFCISTIYLHISCRSYIVIECCNQKLWIMKGSIYFGKTIFLNQGFWFFCVFILQFRTCMFDLYESTMKLTLSFQSSVYRWICSSYNSPSC